MLGIALAGGIVEVGARIYTSTEEFLLSHNPVILKQSEGTTLFEPNEECGHVLKDNSFVGKDKLESLDDVVARARGAETVVLNIGDSSTSGWDSNVVTWNMKRGEGEEIRSPLHTYLTYSGIVGEREGIESINAGIPGHSSDSGMRRIGNLLEDLNQRSVKPDYVTVYYGNNDSVWNLNVEDKDLYPGFFDSHLAAILGEKLDVLSSRKETKTRVGVEDYRDNLQSIVRTIREHGSKPILIEPATPLYWMPGLRAQGQDEESDEWVLADFNASGKLREARRSYNHGVAAIDRGNETLARYLFEQSYDNDFLVPRIKERYREALREVSDEMGVPLVSVVNNIPLDDRDYFIDYCHPIGPANEMIAEEILKRID